MAAQDKLPRVCGVLGSDEDDGEEEYEADVVESFAYQQVMTRQTPLEWYISFAPGIIVFGHRLGHLVPCQTVGGEIMAWDA